MAAKSAQQLTELIKEVDAFGANFGPKHIAAILEATEDIVNWIIYFRGSGNDCARELVDGIQASVLEAVAYSAMGLARASLGAIRQQMELVLAYTYFKDHPVEWEHVRRTGDGFKLPGPVRTYHEETSRDLKARLAVIDRALPLSLRKLYRILSAHIHGQSPYTIPEPGELKSMVKDSEVIDSVVEMQRDVSKALSFYLVALFATHWTELPASIVSEVARSIPAKRRPGFFR